MSSAFLTLLACLTYSQLDRRLDDETVHAIIGEAVQVDSSFFIHSFIQSFILILTLSMRCTLYTHSPLTHFLTHILLHSSYLSINICLSGGEAVYLRSSPRLPHPHSYSLSLTHI